MADPKKSVKKFAEDMEKSMKILSDRLSGIHLQGKPGNVESLRALAIMKQNAERSHSLCLEIEQLQQKTCEKERSASKSAKKAEMELKALEKERRELKQNFDKEMKSQVEAIKSSKDALRTSREETNLQLKAVQSAQLSLQQDHDAKVAPQLTAFQRGVTQLKADQQQLQNERNAFEQMKKDSSSLQSLDETLKGHIECSSKERVAEINREKEAISTKLANSETEARQNQADAVEWKRKHDLLEQQVNSLNAENQDLKEAAEIDRKSREELLISKQSFESKLAVANEMVDPLEKSLSDQRELLTSRQLLHGQAIKTISDEKSAIENALMDQTATLFELLNEVATKADDDQQQQVKSAEAIEYGIRIHFDYLEKKKSDAETLVETTRQIVEGLQQELRAAREFFTSTNKDVLSLFGLQVDASSSLAETIQPKLQDLREELSSAQQSIQKLEQEEKVVLSLFADAMVLDVAQPFSEAIKGQFESIQGELQNTQQTLDDLRKQKKHLLSFLEVDEAGSNEECLTEAVREKIKPLEQGLEIKSRELESLADERKAVLELFNISANKSTLSQVIQPKLYELKQDLQRARQDLSILTGEKMNTLALFEIVDQTKGLVQTVRPKLQLLQQVSSELDSLIKEKKSSLALFDISDQTISLVEIIEPKLQLLKETQSSLSDLLEEKKKSLALFGIEEKLIDTIRLKLEQLDQANITVESLALEKKESLALFEVTDQTLSLAETTQSKLQSFRQQIETIAGQLGTLKAEQKTVLTLVGADVEDSFIPTVRAKVQSFEESLGDLSRQNNLLEEEKKQSLGLFGVEQSSSLFETISKTLMPLQTKLGNLQNEKQQVLQIFDVQVGSTSLVETIKIKIKLLEQEKQTAVAEAIKPLFEEISSLKQSFRASITPSTSTENSQEFSLNEVGADSIYTNQDGSKKQRIHQVSPLVKQHVVSANEWTAVCERENRIYQKLVTVAGTNAYLARQQVASLLGKDSSSFDKLEAYLRQKPAHKKNYQCMLCIAMDGHKGLKPILNDRQCSTCSSQNFEYCPQVRAKSGSNSLCDYRLVPKQKMGSGISFPIKPS